MPSPNDIKLYTLTELQNALGLCHRTLMGYVYTGKLNAVKIGGKWRVTQEEFDRFLSTGETYQARRKTTTKEETI